MTPSTLPDLLDDPTHRRADTAGAVLANGRLLVTLSARGEVEQLVWPHLDHEPQVERLRLGVLDEGTVRWLDEAADDWLQHADPDARVVTTEVAMDGDRLRIVDAVDPEDDVLVREVHTGGRPLVVTVVPAVGGHVRGGAAQVDPATGAAVSYRRDHAMAVLPDVDAEVGLGEPRRGTGAVAGLLAEARPGGDALAHGAHDVVLLSAPADVVRVAIGFGHDVHDAVAVAVGGVDRDVVSRRREHDAGLVAGVVAQVPGGADATALGELVRAALLACDSMTDATGAVLAGPEVDPDFLRSGGYGFVWSRDLAMIVRAMLSAGRTAAAADALRWLAATQGHDGIWPQRQWTDGSPAACWGVQLDETGAVLHAFGVAYELVGDTELDTELWPAMRAGADALVRFRDTDTGLPLPSVDLWEERTGTHAFTVAACAAGLRAAADAGRRNGATDAGERWDEVADQMVAGLHEHFWDDARGRFVRSRWVGRPDGLGSPLPTDFRAPEGHVIGRFRSVDDLDAVVDVSLLGLAEPFGIVAPDDPRMVATVDAVEQALRTSDGGVLRYEDDAYVGGNPWVLATLWLAMARRAAGEGDDDLARALAWTADRRTATHLLPEQVDEATGAPRWVVPLTWSHAMVLLTCTG